MAFERFENSMLREKGRENDYVFAYSFGTKEPDAVFKPFDTELAPAALENELNKSLTKGFTTGLTGGIIQVIITKEDGGGGGASATAHSKFLRLIPFIKNMPCHKDMSDMIGKNSQQKDLFQRW